MASARVEPSEPRIPRRVRETVENPGGAPRRIDERLDPDLARRAVEDGEAIPAGRERDVVAGSRCQGQAPLPIGVQGPEPERPASPEEDLRARGVQRPDGLPRALGSDRPG